MPMHARQLRWGVEKRLEFIEFRLFWEGVINRSDLVDQFEVSVPQASNDLSRYDKLAPNNMLYDKSGKRYVRSPSFRPVLTDPSADDLLVQLQAVGARETVASQTWLSSTPPTDSLPTPHRVVSVDVIRALLAAISENKALELHYQSMNPDHPDPIWRWISPHAFASDGFRWHIRAYCHRDNKFKDFLLSRILKTRNLNESQATAKGDRIWNEYLNVSLIPNPKLTESQQRAISVDYGMKGRRIDIPVRKALLYYFKKRLRLDVADALDRPQEAPVIIENEEEFDSALKEASA
ncbi:MAG TPA: WYL domain-containing protein [Woeseiaceae bacterium]|nr:WYL domain-containing protein [Woeseiaceae bacterium]